MERGFGNASGNGFGSTVTLSGAILWQAGQWEPSYEEESSNLRELKNTAQALDLSFELVLRLQTSEIRAGWKLHVVRAAGTRMICQVARETLSGVMGGKLMLSFVPLHLLALECLQPPWPWVESWWPDGLLEWLSHDDWFAAAHHGWNFAWSPPPAAAGAALEQLCGAQLKCPLSTCHVFVAP